MQRLARSRKATLRRVIAVLAVIGLTLLGTSLAAPAAAIPAPFVISGQITSDLTAYPGSVQVSVGYYSSHAWTYSPPVAVGPGNTYSVTADQGTGEYDLYFTVVGYSVPFLDTYSGDSVEEPDGEDSANAGVINAITGTDMTGPAVTLVAAGYITGAVKSGGVPLAGEDIEAFDQITNEVYDAEAPTDADGLYSIKVPASHVMEVGEVSDSDYYPQFYNGHDLDPAIFDPVTASPGQVTPGIDFNLDPIIGSIFVGFGVESNPAPPQPADNVTVKLTVLDDLGNVVGTKSTVVHTGFGFIVSSMVGDYQVEISNSAGKRFAMDRVSSGGTDDPFFVPGSCVADLGSIDQAELDLGTGGIIEFDLNPNLSLCNAPDPTPTLPKHRHLFILSGSTATATASPTPTPTPTPTETPSATPSATPSEAPSPKPAVSTGGLPWWAWLLIILVVVLLLVGLGFVLLRRR